MESCLVLADGTVYPGTSFGAAGEAMGEVIFTTGMTGYLETLTDPAFAGQIIVHTFPLVGNYGVIPADFEGAKVYAAGYILSDCCADPSNFRCQGSLEAFLKEQGVVCLRGVDTRALTRRLRREGVCNGRIMAGSEAAVREQLAADPGLLAAIGRHRVNGAVAACSAKAPAVYEPQGQHGYDVALMDYGARQTLVRTLQQLGCRVTVYPHNTPAETVLAQKPNGILLSNGPGDPADNAFEIQQIQRMTQSGVPVWGVGLGHQMLALAAGFQREKLPFGHFGANQPARECDTGYTYITQQNHGYGIVRDSVRPKVADIWFSNLNDQSVEGLRYRQFPAFSVEFHPDSGAGPRSTAFLYEQFMALMSGAAETA